MSSTSSEQANKTGTTSRIMSAARACQATNSTYNLHSAFNLYQTSAMCVAGRQYASRLTAGPGARPLLPSPFQMQPRPESSGAQPSGGPQSIPPECQMSAWDPLVGLGHIPLRHHSLPEVLLRAAQLLLPFSELLTRFADSNPVLRQCRNACRLMVARVCCAQYLRAQQ